MGVGVLLLCDRVPTRIWQLFSSDQEE